MRKVKFEITFYVDDDTASIWPRISRAHGVIKKLCQQIVGKPGSVFTSYYLSAGEEVRDA